MQISRKLTVAALSVPLALSMALSAGAPAAHADSTFSVPAGARTLTVVGQGHGHGHGLSQYGADAAARRGLGHRRILAHYYPGTSVGRAGGKIRVLLSTRKRLVVKARPGLRIRVTGGPTLRVDRLGKRKARRATTWRAEPVRAGSARISYRTQGRWRTLRKVRGDVEFSAGRAPLALRAGADSGTFRGALRLASTRRGGTDRDVVNVVGLEDYLRSVVPAEMPALWHPAAVRAQAVAARSYAAYERSSTERGHFDVYDTTQSQVYSGVVVEHPASTRAVRATKREIRTHRGKPAFTQFSASNGGWMLANSTVPYLVSRADPYDPVNAWRVTIPMAEMAARFGSTYPLASIRVRTHPAAGPWVDTVTLIGVSGARNTVSGEAFRAWAGLRSASFRFGD